MNAIEIATAPSSYPVSVNELKDYLRLDGDEQDDLLESLIAGSTEAIGNALKRTFLTTEFVQYENFLGEIELFRPPLQSVENVKYYDSDGILQTLSSDVFLVDSKSAPGKITLAPNQSWPTVQSRENAVIVEFTAGFGTASDVPDAIKIAIKMTASDFYEHPEANVELKLQENKALNRILSIYALPEIG